MTATGPTCVAANTASTAAVVLGDAAPGWLGDARRDRPAGRARRHVSRTGGWPADDPRKAQRSR